MTNLEFYKDKIKDYCNHNELTPAVMSVMSDNEVDYDKYDDSDDSDVLVLNWLCEEYKEPLLTAEEREYLSTVIKPYRDKCDSITIEKCVYTSRLYESILIRLETNCYRDCMSLPHFKKETLYKGLETGKTYTLEELGL